jgi:hypothetical protein
MAANREALRPFMECGRLSQFSSLIERSFILDEAVNPESAKNFVSVEDPILHLTHIHGALRPAMACRRDYRLHNHPFGLSPIARVTKATALRSLAVLDFHIGRSIENQAPINEP